MKFFEKLAKTLHKKPSKRNKVAPENIVQGPYVEVDPTGRFWRYNDLLGSGATKKIYRALDKEKGCEVAWNKVNLEPFLEHKHMLRRLHEEVLLLKTLKSDFVIKLFGEWMDYENSTINFITELCSLGNLRQYRNKHVNVSIMVIKKWSRQILEGLEYLHMREQGIIHRDINPSNVFINGKGEVKIGDFGFAKMGRVGHHVVGTPEYMAPEIYEENYNEKVDIYAFGMCLLELLTMEMPYLECFSNAHIYKRVSGGVKPKALDKVCDPEVKAFIEKCIEKEYEKRSSASELLKDPFFHGIGDFDWSGDN